MGKIKNKRKRCRYERKQQLAKKRKHRAYENIDATTDTVVESNSVTPIVSCQTIVQAVNTENVKGGGEAIDKKKVGKAA